MNNNFIKLTFLWSYEGKSTACLFFVYYLCLYMIFSVISNGNLNNSIDFYTIIQMLILSTIIGSLQIAVVLKQKLSVKRFLIWGAIVMILTIFCVEYFEWFIKFGKWCSYFTYGINIFMIYIFFITLKISLDDETERMNKALKNFQSNYKKY